MYSRCLMIASLGRVALPAGMATMVWAQETEPGTSGPQGQEKVVVPTPQKPRCTLRPPVVDHPAQPGSPL